MKKVVVSRLFNVLSDSEDAISTSTMLKIDKIRKDNNLFINLSPYRDSITNNISFYISNQVSQVKNFSW